MNTVCKKGFTLIEMLVVMAIIGTLLALVAPRYFKSMEHARETALKHDLAVTREAIGRFYSDLNHYPQSLDELVQRRYLKTIPIDPITGSSETWIITQPPDQAQSGVYDISSGAEGVASDGTEFKSW
ncbi:type II secretion system protein [Novimethylophilus kurashikiensis]|nr:prepilin-type N-terminal cleavage/methylation domain-containing protein [Novimethylophilus kurashikiensis]